MQNYLSNLPTNLNKEQHARMYIHLALKVEDDELIEGACSHFTLVASELDRHWKPQSQAWLVFGESVWGALGTLGWAL